jgi:uncharacterized phage protein (TIGR01671 family)
MAMDKKFRVWDRQTGTMIVPSPSDGAFRIDQNGAVRVPVTDREFGNCVLEQYTGLKDDNGVEIYEGDILYFSIYKKHAAVYWDDRFYGWFAESVGIIPHKRNEISLFDIYTSPGWDAFEVVGNIHENPELLERKA